MAKATITKEAALARAQYLREWRAKNKQKVKEYNDRYWNRRIERQNDTVRY